MQDCEPYRIVVCAILIMTLSFSENQLRIGAVRYLNSSPLVERLPSLLPNVKVRLYYPSRLADDLADGLLDVALVPSIEVVRHPEYEIVSDACVATCGPVLSVMLYSRTPLHKISRLAIDAGSRTSAALVRILLAQRFGITPEIELLPLSHAVERSRADAMLLIGDRALHLPTEKFLACWDLGEEWFRQTGLPFVFACWVSRPNQCSEKVTQVLNRSRDWGVESLQQIAQAAAPSLSIDANMAYLYLREHLSYHLGPVEKKGLQLFHDLVVEFDLLADGITCKQRDEYLTRDHQNMPLPRNKCA